MDGQTIAAVAYRLANNELTNLLNPISVLGNGESFEPRNSAAHIGRLCGKEKNGFDHRAASISEQKWRCDCNIDPDKFTAARNFVTIDDTLGSCTTTLKSRNDLVSGRPWHEIAPRLWGSRRCSRLGRDLARLSGLASDHSINYMHAAISCDHSADTDYHLPFSVEPGHDVMTTQFTNPIHLYRSLLRETTYLFDPHVRTYIHQYVNNSFRAKATTAQSKNPQSSTHNASLLPTIDERHQLKRGRKFLSILQRANQGYRLPVSNVIKLAYGRKGRKKREIMAKIMTKDDSQDSQLKARLIKELSSKGVSPPVTTRGEAWVPPAKFYALLQSQAKMQCMLDGRRRLKLRPDIPILNKKGLPMPKSRAKNMTKAWYAASASMLYPYLEEQEWDILRDRAAGQGFVIPRRRSTASVRVFSEDEPPFVMEALHLLKGAAKPLSKSQKFILGNPHKLKVRYLKRIYDRELLRNTPKAVRSSTGARLHIHWDDGHKRLPSTKSLGQGQQSELLFGSK